jgi:hypothetical protein
MLTGDEMITSGEAFVHHRNVKTESRQASGGFNEINKIVYCILKYKLFSCIGLAPNFLYKNGNSLIDYS